MKKKFIIVTAIKIVAYGTMHLIIKKVAGKK